MKALIKPKEYFDEKTLNREQIELFGSTWNFVCFKQDLLKENDFITAQIGGVPVVVQNLRGVIKAFKNVCSHRHSIIQTVEKGNRSLMCPYHGWAYDKKGIPKGIPKKPLFNFTKEELVCLKLKEYQLETCGALVFVKVSDDLLSLKEYLGELYTEVEEITGAFGELIDVNKITIKANWKILVENTLESYHVNLIHEETLKRLEPSGMEFNFINNHSTWRAPLKLREDDKKLLRVHKPFQERPYKIEGYEHLMLFPNTLISSTYGISFNLSTITPIDSESSIFTSYVFMTKILNPIEDKKPIQKVYEQSLIDFNRKVFDEDKEICQKVQIGVRYSNYDGELSDEEERVCEFQKAYKNYLK
ncbi:(2Fe-2S)-binding protein [Polaribacter pacificus]|uniref:(2Fe-2S)-binding protein n=1 Tax=Polaribacter pacificus TaxID=1775173 RepID=A0A917I114_9FLAO|nr:SRPBCC family protein [Polaribacter pacificus]GGH01669.1 (2Fe-2S)-binding protein [Polaribacter pacificus]